ncbi:hypothetical protein RB620_06700 [Paenibacillus sp. LHD-117]|uniref:hypothetical protein n=1 Tax=Paenibacillus sp. LHD-117 TaxID=3071412 RepID=UPI0027E2058B|nr:hypothetical protein [Paenibacillus sp. LHD-117]MDQ6419126.1 hypothetical protein [Paenibacillus sp. LHD-117]
MPTIEPYLDFLRSLPGGKLTREHLLVPELLLEERGRLSVYYVPYDYVNEAAKLMIIGITPGFTQMETAIREARDCLREGVPISDIDRRAKFAASFAGTMRANLVRMLDLIGIPSLIGVGDSGELFGASRPLLHTTSAIRYPVFVNGRNYTGHGPSILQSDLLSGYARTIFLNEVKRVEGALLIPLGKAVGDVLRAFAEEGMVDPARCLFDFPHPSGANGHRWKQLEEHKDKLARQAAKWYGATDRSFSI